MVTSPLLMDGERRRAEVRFNYQISSQYIYPLTMFHMKYYRTSSARMRLCSGYLFEKSVEL